MRRDARYQVVALKAARLIIIRSQSEVVRVRHCVAFDAVRDFAVGDAMATPTFGTTVAWSTRWEVGGFPLGSIRWVQRLLDRRAEGLQVHLDALMCTPAQWMPATGTGIDP